MLKNDNLQEYISIDIEVRYRKAARNIVILIQDNWKEGSDAIEN
jgi:hypothetical protein